MLSVRRTPRIVVMLMLLASLVACSHENRTVSAVGNGANGSRQLIFQIISNASEPSPVLVSELIATMRRRLVATNIKADVFVSSGSLLRATIYDGSRIVDAAKLLSTTGTVVLRIQPRGPEYHPPSGRPFKGAEVIPGVAGGPGLIYISSDSNSMSEFTRRQVGQLLGIYFDGRLIDESKLMGPISSMGEMHRYCANEAQCRAREAHYRFMAAVIDSGPLQAHVGLLSSSAVTSV